MQKHCRNDRKDTKLLLERLKTQLSITVVSATVGAFVYYITSPAPIVILPLLAAISFISMSMITAMHGRAKSLYAEKRMTDDIVARLYGILFLKGAGIPMQMTVEKAVSEAKESAVVFGDARNRFMFGEPLDEAMQGVFSKISGKLSSVPHAQGSEYLQTKSIVDSYESDRDERSAVVAESVQKYATVNMFLSTLLPSFSIFAFVGTTIITPHAGSMLLMSILMLAVLPLIYAAGSSMVSRRLFEW